MTGQTFIKNAIFWAVVGGMVGYQEGASTLLLLGIGSLEIHNIIVFCRHLMNRKEVLIQALDAKWALVFDKRITKLDEGFIYYSREKECIQAMHEKDPDDWAVPVYQKQMDLRFKALAVVLAQATVKEKTTLIYWLECEQAVSEPPFVLASELRRLLVAQDMVIPPPLLESTDQAMPLYAFQRHQNQELVFNSNLNLHHRIKTRTNLFR